MTPQRRLLGTSVLRIATGDTKKTDAATALEEALR